MSGESKRPRRPYLIRAMHDWMSDNGETPHLVVDCSVEGVNVPAEFVRDERIILNVSYSATSEFIIGDSTVEFEARFGGVSRPVSIPVVSVIGIYSKETGEGMIFGDEGPDKESDDGSAPKKGKKPHLKVIK